MASPVPASVSQYEQQAAGRVPKPEMIRPGIWSIPVPYRRAVPYTLCYVIRDQDRRLHVIDPGADEPGNRRMLTAQLASLNLSIDDVASVTLTHLHADHSGLAPWLAERNDLPVQWHAHESEDARSGAGVSRFFTSPEVAGERWSVPQTAHPRLSIPVDAMPSRPSVPRNEVLLRDGDLTVPQREVRALHTPGHTRGHLCFALPDDGLILTGDHVLPGTYAPIGPANVANGSPIADYLASMDRLAFADQYEVAPGHGYRFFGLGPRRERIRQHVLRRAREVETAVDALGPAPGVWEVASRLYWRGGLDGLRGTDLRSALGQTEMYIDFVRGGSGGANFHNDDD